MEGTGPTATIEVRFGTASHTGLVRDLNEDRLLASTPVFVVADGMGGHEAGEVASSVTVESFLPLLGRADVTRDEVAKLIAEANVEVRRRSEGIIDGIGTTLAGLVVVDGGGGAEFLGINVGDSRVYRLRAGRLEQLSVDHSFVQELLSAGRITRGEADSHPQRNVITRAVGVDPEVEPDLWTISPDPGERYLVSSDGLLFALRNALVAGERVAVLAPTAQAIGHDLVTWKQSPAEPAGFAHELYASLRELDALGCARLLVQQPPAGENWLAVNDRLRRAAAGSGEDDET